MSDMTTALYISLCKNIGFPKEVAIRREVMDLEEKISTLRSTKCQHMIMKSGSNKEGFRFSTSDVDYMFWLTDHKLIWDYNQSLFYGSSNTTLIMTEFCESRPGFALLKLLTPSVNISVVSACIKLNEGLYVSSSFYRDATFSLTKMKDSTIHGPCTSGCLSGMVEYDFAHCFSSDFWPPIASSFVERCQIKGWPSPQILHDIMSYGCHVVPIGRRNSPQICTEWRISFSVAEQKLVYAMNHCQFLCYGMLKIFLKERINNNTEEHLLCSYFLKTVVFWEIQAQENWIWSPHNILICFWQCVKHLIKLVLKGECPNFFIPTNNMFYGKIVGSARTRLLSQLYDLYNEGISCVINCPSIKRIIDIINKKNLAFDGDINENAWTSTACHDRVLFNEIEEIVNSTLFNLQDCHHLLSTLETLQNKPLSVYQILTLQKCVSAALVSTAFHLHYAHKRGRYTNRGHYDFDNNICYVLKRAEKLCNESNIYIAMYYYLTYRYQRALRYVETVKVKLSRPYLMRKHLVNWKKYNDAVQGMSLSARMRETYTSDVVLHTGCPFIRELELEIKAKERKSGLMLLYMPQLVMVNMLSVLCNRDKPRKQEEAIQELQILNTHDDGKHIDSGLRNISWQILGISQQIYGDLHGALISYQQALTYTIQDNQIEEATKARIRHVQFLLENKDNL